MVDVPDVNPLVDGLGLRVAAQAEVGITGHEQFLIDRPMRIVAGHAAFPHGIVFKHEGPGLILVALGAIFVRLRHGQSPGWFEEVSPMGIVALHTIHVSFDHRMMLGQHKFALHFQMAFKAGGRILPGINDELGAAAGFNMPAAGPMTGFAPSLAGHGGGVVVKPAMRAGGKFMDEVGVTILAGTVADVMGTGNFQGGDHHARFGDTGNGQQRQTGGNTDG